MTTKAELVQQVGEDLALVAIGQGLDSQDKTRIENTYTQVYNKLKQLGLATWASTGDIPSECTPYVALMVEEKLLTTYSVPDARYQRIKLDAGLDGKEAVKNLTALLDISTPDYAELTDY